MQSIKNKKKEKGERNNVQDTRKRNIAIQFQIKV